uniref:Uncharacterized protein n=1 Tax=Arundo donax TaxID=35708 RepID=A0A0A9FL75_ARUDO
MFPRSSDTCSHATYEVLPPESGRRCLMFPTGGAVHCRRNVKHTRTEIVYYSRTGCQCR